MSNMKRLFEDLQEIYRLQQSQPEGVDLPTILRLVTDGRNDDQPAPTVADRDRPYIRQFPPTSQWDNTSKP